MKQDGRLGGRTASASLIHIPSAPATLHKDYAPAGTPGPWLRLFTHQRLQQQGPVQGNLPPRARKSQGRPPPSFHHPHSIREHRRTTEGVPRPRRISAPPKYLFSSSAEQLEVSFWESLLPIERKKHKALSSEEVPRTFYAFRL